MPNSTQNARPTLLIADDDESLCQQLHWAMQSEYRTQVAHTPAEILTSCARHKPDLVLLDLNFTKTTTDGKEGIKIIQEILGKQAAIKIIVMTGNQEWEVARQAINAGAYDHFVKPINVEELKTLLRRAYLKLQLEEERPPAGETTAGICGDESIIAVSAEMRAIFALVDKVSLTDATVLIGGESGTGKELIASMIHRRSPRAQQKFVPINCGAIPDNLLESELFGHEKGAFTGAVSLRKGKFEIANGGTIFLDEIGELTAPLQVKILRFLQDHVIERVGGNTSLALDVRIIAATNRNLQTEILRENFREDLYYRLNVISIEIPPLRRRGEDIDLLADYFLKKFSTQYSKPIRGLAPEARKAIRDFHWPGNIREMENKIRKAVILARHSVILPEDLALTPKTNQQKKSLRNSIDHFERDMLVNSLRRHHGVIAHVAADLGINRITLYSLLKKHQIDHHEFKQNSKDGRL
jgi:two-component system NtrC family response regulator